MSTNKGHYYNDNDPAKCHMVRALIADGIIPDGEVDERSILDVKPDDLKGFAQWHFFCGICGWPIALKMAGWPEDRPACTASLPCQPFSMAGKRKGMKDERHLWPVFAELVRECRFDTIFGEQVEAAIRLGWLDRVFSDLEQLSYACGAVCAPACSVGAPHIRQRLYWLADAEHSEPGLREPGEQGQEGRGRAGLADDGPDGGLGDTGSEGQQGHRPELLQGRDQQQSTQPDRGPWSDTRTILCRDGKARRVPVEPGLFPLAARIPGRVHLLRGAGDAIVPPLAAEFIKAYMSIQNPPE